MVKRPAVIRRMINAQRKATRMRNMQDATATGIAQIVTILVSEASNRTNEITIKMAMQQLRKIAIRTRSGE
ncbi:hypothetical protein KDK_75200 [Dictyobacter kobayashii]|uniref:Uncharacterized protein n=1 Tax=Dictyobacter kobayashii TaxID=2014872 RepID=A0A402AX52_9CHLR|nr:hypothetical protein KDK_75200 [Dictyobacter kobayashii]